MESESDDILDYIESNRADMDDVKINRNIRCAISLYSNIQALKNNNPNYQKDYQLRRSAAIDAARAMERARDLKYGNGAYGEMMRGAFKQSERWLISNKTAGNEDVPGAGTLRPLYRKNDALGRLEAHSMMVDYLERGTPSDNEFGRAQLIMRREKRHIFTLGFEYENSAMEADRDLAPSYSLPFGSDPAVR